MVLFYLPFQGNSFRIVGFQKRLEQQLDRVFPIVPTPII